jgi:hypothetical protein
VLVFDWRALSIIRSEIGQGGLEHAMTGTDLEMLAKVISAGLRRNHGEEWPAEKIMELSPPLLPAVKAIETAINLAYWGPKGVPDIPEENPPNPPKTRLQRLWRQLTGQE